MKKKFIVLLAVCLVLPFAVLFSACKNQSAKRLIELEASIGGQSGHYVDSSTYDYGTTGSYFDFWSDLKLIAKYSDGSSLDLATNETEARKVQIFASNNGAEWEEFSYSKVYDAGNLSLKFVYEGQDAFVNVAISMVDKDNTNAGISISKLGQTSTQSYAFGTSEIDGGGLISEYKLQVFEGGTAISYTEIEGVYCLTQEEYDVYRGISTREAQQEFLRLHADFSAEDDNDDLIRCLTYNTDHYSDTEIYINTNNTKIVPSTTNYYYAFAKIYPQANYYSYFTTPSSSTRFKVFKGTISFSDSIFDEENELTTASQILSYLNLSANFSYGMNYETGEYFIGNVRLGDLLIDNRNDADINRLNIRVNNFEGSSVIGFGAGHFQFKNANSTINSTNNGQAFFAEFVFNDGSGYVDYYDLTNNTTNVVVNIEKCEVQKPYIVCDSFYNELTEQVEFVVEKEYEYNYGKSIAYDLKNTDDLGALNVVGSISATDLGNYTVKFTLKDDVNYFFADEESYDNYYYGNENGEFTWRVVKRDVANHCVGVLSYSDRDDDINSEVFYFNYDGSNKEFSLKIESEKLYNWDTEEFDIETDAEYFEGRTFVWYVNDVLVTDAQNLENVIAFSNISNDMKTYEVKIVSEATDNFVGFVKIFYINIRAYEYPTEVLEYLIGDNGDVPAYINESSNYYLYTTGQYVINKEEQSNTTKYYWATKIPTTSLVDEYENPLGVWTLKAYNIEDYEATEIKWVEGKGYLICTTESSLDYIISSNGDWRFEFVPNDDCIAHVVVHVTGGDGFIDIVEL